jgi:hypothetical protein
MPNPPDPCQEMGGLVEVGAESGAEAVQEGDGAALGIEGRARAREPQGPADGAKEDPEDGAGDLRIVMDLGAEAFGNGEDPLAHGQVRQDVVGEVGGQLGHGPGVAGGADPPALEGEGDQALLAAVVTAWPRRSASAAWASKVSRWCWTTG